MKNSHYNKGRHKRKGDKMNQPSRKALYHNRCYYCRKVFAPGTAKVFGLRDRFYCNDGCRFRIEAHSCAWCGVDPTNKRGYCGSRPGRVFCSPDHRRLFRQFDQVK